MRLMISGATKNVAQMAAHPFFRDFLGVMITPNTGNSLDWVCSLGLQWVVDNGCYDYTRFSTQKYLSLLHRVAALPCRPVFVTVPDQAPRPGQDNEHCHACTAYLFERWFRRLEVEGLDGLPLAFVAQNGLDDVEDIPWDAIAVLFIGGDDDFKLGDFVMQELIPAAKQRGKHVHLGRVNGRRRLRHAVMADVDSVDGTSMSRFGDAYILKYLATTVQAVIERQQIDALSEEMEEQLAPM